MSNEAESKGTYIMPEANESGRIQIADDVIATIVGLATTEIEGVAELQGGITKDVIGKLGIKNNSKGLKITLSDNTLNTEMSIVMEYGYSIPKVTKQIQEHIKAAIESMIGFNVGNVDIHVIGVNMENA